MNVQQALQLAREQVEENGQISTLEAQVLLAEILGHNRSVVLAHPELELNSNQQLRFRTDLEQVRSGVPLAFLLGWKDFYGRRFDVTHETLIPRPETEQLVERALEILRGREHPRVVDVGTGTGCIAITIACEYERASLLATDRSPGPLKVAKRNAVKHAVSGQLQWLLADLLSPIRGRFDLLCANLPYIPSERLRSLAVSEHEPVAALDGGQEGMDYTARLIRQLPDILAPNGTALFEIDQGQGDPLGAIARTYLPGCNVHIEQDAAGLERLLLIEGSAK